MHTPLFSTKFNQSACSLHALITSSHRAAINQILMCFFILECSISAQLVPVHPKPQRAGTKWNLLTFHQFHQCMILLHLQITSIVAASSSYSNAVVTAQILFTVSRKVAQSSSCTCISCRQAQCLKCHWHVLMRSKKSKPKTSWRPLCMAPASSVTSMMGLNW